MVVKGAQGIKSNSVRLTLNVLSASDINCKVKSSQYLISVLVIDTYKLVQAHDHVNTWTAARFFWKIIFSCRFKWCQITENHVKVDQDPWRNMASIGRNRLSRWGWVMHICIVKLTIIGADNGLLPGQRQAIIWTSAGILLIGLLRTNFSRILIRIHTFSFMKTHLKMLSSKWLPFCLVLNVLMVNYHWYR